MATGALPAVAHGQVQGEALSPGAKGRKVGSLLTRLERATDEERPASALIAFANSLSGTVGRAPRNYKPGSSYCSTPTGQKPWRESPTGRRRTSSLGSSPRLGSCYTPQPCWAPQPGSRTRSRLTRELRSARYFAKCVPSVRAYARVGEPEESAEEQMPEAEEEAAPEDTAEEPQPAEAWFGRALSTPPPPASPPPEQRDEVHIPWSEWQLTEVFKKFSDADEREVHIEELQPLLRYLGARTTEAEVLSLVREQTMYSSVDWFEFMEFIKHYRKWDLEQLKAAFESADIDGNGTLDVNELHQLLVTSGYSPTKEATEEAFRTIDDDHSGTVSFDEFEQLRELLRSTRGFLKAEADELRMLFDRVATGPNKLLPTEELWRICGYIGYNVTPQDLRTVLLQVDKNCSGFISYDELLGVIRGIRDCEGERLLNVISGYEAAQMFSVGKPLDRPRSGRRTSALVKSGTDQRSTSKKRQRATVAVPKSLKLINLAPAFAQLGYFVSPEITEIILDTQLADREQPDRLAFDELALFLRAYRRAEGFTQKELDFLKECFDREQSVSVAGNDDDSLDALELGRVLRGFGISRTLQQVQRMIEEIDFDGSGQLEFEEFAKLMRQLFHEEAQQRRKVFDTLDTMQCGCIEVSSIEEAMTMINGVQPEGDMIQEALESSLGPFVEELTIAQFEKFFEAYRGLLMESVAVHAGFIPSEVEMLRSVFAKYDLEASGSLKATELRALVHDLIPEASQSIQGRADVMKMLEELSPDQSELDFAGFLWLMRKCHDQRDERDILKEAEVVKSCEYTPEEVEGLRQIFSSNINWAGEITFEALADLFRRIITVGEQDEEELRLLIHHVCKTPKHRTSVRFPQFMMLMRHLTQQNSFGLNEAADRIARRKEPKKQRNRFEVVVDKRRRGGVVQNAQAQMQHLPGQLATMQEEEDAEAT